MTDADYNIPLFPRALVEKRIEELISLLDYLDTDPDLEDDGTAEEEPDAEQDTADDEPSLGSLTSCGYHDGQEGWADGNRNDLEKTGAATETDDEEPTLGWAANLDQSRLGVPVDDLEPSLGWSDMEARYGRYELLACGDLEEEHDGREPEHDNEAEGYSPSGGAGL